MVIFKITKVSPNFRSYLWKTVVVTHHCRILHSGMGRAEGKTFSSMA